MNDLSDLLHDAVADIEPTDRLDEIRSRTASPVRAGRPWRYAAGATVLATAATVAAFAVIGNDDGSEPVPSDHGQDDPSTLVAAYFIGDTPSGPRLFREFDEVPDGDGLRAALERIQQMPSDPDYSTPWDEGSFTDATVEDGVITVHIGTIDPSVDASQLGVQQVVYTLQGATGARFPVQFVEDDGFVYMGPMDAAGQRHVLSLISISDPAEGNGYADSLIARGRAQSPTGTASWTLRRGDDVVRRGSLPAGTNSLEPWEVSIDLTGVDPGRYTFEVRQDSPPNAFFVPTTDTRTITVR